MVERYCSPTKKLVAIPVTKVEKTKERWDLSFETNGFMTARRIPRLESSPPKARANMINMMVSIMATIPPRFSKAAKVALCDVVWKPLTTKFDQVFNE